jgi:hypothetical protein
MPRLAREHDLITDETLSAIDGLRMLRNLAAHGGGRDISTGRAQEFVALADTVSYSLQKAAVLAQQQSTPAES